MNWMIILILWWKQPDCFFYLSSEQEHARNLQVQFTNENQARVKGFPDDFSVDLQTNSCSCFAPKEYGWPCRHLLVAHRELQLDSRRRFNVLELFSPCYLKNTCKQGHSFSVPPISRSSLVHDRTKLPADAVKKRGRPKTARIKSNTDLLLRPSRPLACSNCKQTGHNKRKCPRPLPPR